MVGLGTAAGGGAVNGMTTGTGTGTVANGTGAHPYAAAGAGAHMRTVSQGQGQGRYVGYFGETGGNGRRVAQESGMNVNGGSAGMGMGMGMETARGMGVQDGQGGDREDRKGFLGVLCCR